MPAFGTANNSTLTTLPASRRPSESLRIKPSSRNFLCASAPFTMTASSMRSAMIRVMPAESRMSSGRTLIVSSTLSRCTSASPSTVDTECASAAGARASQQRAKRDRERGRKGEREILLPAAFLPFSPAPFLPCSLSLFAPPFLFISPAPFLPFSFFPLRRSARTPVRPVARRPARAAHAGRGGTTGGSPLLVEDK